MPEFGPNPLPPNAHRPLAHAIGWFSAALQYAKARIELAVVEAKEAGAHYGFAAGMFAGAAILSLFGYLFLMLAAVFGLALLFDHERAWIPVMGGMALLHLGGAAALVMLARKRLRTGPFARTKEELTKDKLWLTHSAKTP
jgi:uncharacterized membrane protein YqjE